MFSTKSIIIAFIAATAGLTSALPRGQESHLDQAVPRAAATSGDLTHYDVGAGFGACGQMHSNSELVVAIDPTTYGNDPNPNNSKQCGRSIRVKYGGKSAVVKVVDKCPGCKTGDLDLSPAAFKQVVGDLGIGRVRGTWDWI